MISMARRSRLSNSQGSTRAPGWMDGVLLSAGADDLDDADGTLGSLTFMVLQFSGNTSAGQRVVSKNLEAFQKK
jgi:hypothetical protein